GERPAEPLLVEALQVRHEVVDHGIAARYRLDLQLRAAARAVVLAQHVPARVAVHILGIDLAQRLLRVADIDQRLQLPVVPVGAELVPALALDDVLVGALGGDEQVVAEGQHDRLVPRHTRLEQLDVGVEAARVLEGRLQRPDLAPRQLLAHEAGEGGGIEGHGSVLGSQAGVWAMSCLARSTSGVSPSPATPRNMHRYRSPWVITSGSVVVSRSNCRSPVTRSASSDAAGSGSWKGYGSPASTISKKLVLRTLCRYPHAAGYPPH